ncbi:CPBP family intramembrane metalloprotease [Chitinophagaceae bacterium LB-8]|uniref:CPBP family intramembrane metalloprotease n=1 Tax=Paraflavisolibacter caeni TaxID=2982496 RepID=A0A9X2XMR6_9BACT|nr:CPBP family intramembrane metalloprotease [Paraflavisolibacter caeni]MCU7547678.1 CPBP family intramembrane metalloprotease [Paraflavisolibacter caeni]
MQSYLKTRPVWIQLLLFLGMAFGTWTILSLTAGIIVTKITGISFLELSNMKNWDNSNLSNKVAVLRTLQLAQFLGLFLIPSLLFAYFSDPKPDRYIGLKKPSNHIFWLLGIGAMVISIPLVEYLGMLNRTFVFGPETQRWIQSKEEEALKLIQFMLSKHTPWQLILNLIFIAAFAAIGEELFFRGVLQRLFIKAFKNPWVGILVTAMIFSAFHFQFFGFLPRMALGVLLGMIYWFSGSLLTAIAAHFAYDALLVILAYLKPELAADAEATMFDQSNLASVALISAGIVGVIVWQMIKRSRSSYVDVYKHDTTKPHDFTFD